MVTLPQDDGRRLVPPYVMLLEHVCVEERNADIGVLIRSLSEGRATEFEDVQGVSEVATHREVNIFTKPVFRHARAFVEELA